MSKKKNGTPEKEMMTLYTHDEMLDRVVGKIGTPRRDAYEKALEEELMEYHRNRRDK